VRITSSYNAHNPVTLLYTLIHEATHQVYLQNLSDEHRYQPVGQFAGYAVHEAITLLYEAFMCRSDEFLAYLFSRLSSSLKITQEEFIHLMKKPYLSPIESDSETLFCMLHIIEI
ncbi:Putative metalloprotease YpwA, partial [Hyalomma marginatum]